MSCGGEQRGCEFAVVASPTHSCPTISQYDYDEVKEAQADSDLKMPSR